MVVVVAEGGQSKKSGMSSKTGGQGGTQSPIPSPISTLLSLSRTTGSAGSVL